MQQEVTAYYDELARRYDEDRFANSYGQYLDAQERALLKRYLPPAEKDQHLDLGCGTGRFLDFAAFGADASTEMINVAQTKFPDRELSVALADQLPYANQQFKRVYSLHVFMHLNREMIGNIFSEVQRIIQPGGLFLFDLPSAKRRQLVHYRAANWHGAFSADLPQVKEMAGEGWEVLQSFGLGSLPIHRIPTSLRQSMRSLDTVLGRTPLKAYSSYLLYILRKK